MAENKGYMTLSDEQGSIHISEEVIAAIAVGAVREVEGVSGMMGNLGTSVADLVTNKKGAQKNAKGSAWQAGKLSSGERTRRSTREAVRPR